MLLFRRDRVGVNLVVHLRGFEADTRPAAGSVKVQHLFERLEFAIVHVRRVQDDVAQRRHFKGVLVALAFGHVEAPEVRIIAVKIGNADDLEIAVGEGRHAVALEAARAPRAEEIKAAHLRRRQRRAVARRITVKGRVVGRQRALESGDCFGDVFKGDARTTGAAKGRVELLRVFRNVL